MMNMSTNVTGDLKEKAEALGDAIGEGKTCPLATELALQQALLPHPRCPRNCPRRSPACSAYLCAELVGQMYGRSSGSEKKTA